MIRLPKAYIAILTLNFILLVIFVPIGANDLNILQVKSEGASSLLPKTDEDVLPEVQVTSRDILVFLHNKKNVLTWEAFNLTSSLLYLLRSDPIIHPNLVTTRPIDNVYSAARQTLKSFYSGLQKITVLANLTTFIMFNGTAKFISSFYESYVQDSNTTQALITGLETAISTTTYEIQFLAGGLFAQDLVTAFLNNLSIWWNEAFTIQPELLQDRVAGTKAVDQILESHGLTWFVNETDPDFESLFDQILYKFDLTANNYWNETSLTEILAKWLLGSDSPLNIRTVRKAFGGGDFTTPIRLAEEEFIDFLNQKIQLPGFPKETIDRILELFTNYDSRIQNTPTISLFTVSLKSNLTNQEVLDLYSYIRDLLSPITKNTSYALYIFSDIGLQSETKTQYEHEFARIDQWAIVLAFLAILIVSRRLLFTILSELTLISAILTSRGVLVTANILGLHIAREGYVIGNSLLMGAAINYTMFMIGAFVLNSKKEESLMEAWKRGSKNIFVTSSVVFAAAFPLYFASSADLLSTISRVILLQLPILVFQLLSVFPLIYYVGLHRDETIKKKKQISYHLPHLPDLSAFTLKAIKHARKILLTSILVSTVLMGLIWVQGTTDNPLDLFAREQDSSSEALLLIGNNFPPQYLSRVFLQIAFSEPIPENLTDTKNPVILELYTIQNILAQLELHAIFSPVSPYGELQPSKPQGYLPNLVANEIGENFVLRNRTTALFLISMFESIFRNKIREEINSLLKIVSEEIETRSLVQKVELQGLPILAHEQFVAIERDLRLLVPISILLAFAVLLVWTRSFLLPLRFQYTVFAGLLFSIFLIQTLLHITGQALNTLVIVVSLGLLNAFGLDFDIYFYFHFMRSKGTVVERMVAALDKSFLFIFIAGIVMTLSFAQLIYSPIPFISQLGITLVGAILIDIFVMRFFLSPIIVGALEMMHSDNKVMVE